MTNVNGNDPLDKLASSIAIISLKTVESERVHTEVAPSVHGGGSNKATQSGSEQNTAASVHETGNNAATSIIVNEITLPTLLSSESMYNPLQAMNILLCESNRFPG